MNNGYNHTPPPSDDDNDDTPDSGADRLADADTNIGAEEGINRATADEDDLPTAGTRRIRPDTEEEKENE